MYTYGWFMYRFDRKQQNSVKQLSFNKKKKIEEKKKKEFFLPFNFCPPKVGPGVFVSFVQGEICDEFLFLFVCLFCLWWARLSEVLILSADYWVVFLFCFLFRWGILHRVLLVVGWCRILYSVVSFVWVLTIWHSSAMATHSSVLAWRIPGTGEPGGLLSMGLHRVGHNWSDLAAAAAGLVLWLSSV